MSIIKILLSLLILKYGLYGSWVGVRLACLSVPRIERARALHACVISGAITAHVLLASVGRRAALDGSTARSARQSSRQSALIPRARVHVCSRRLFDLSATALWRHPRCRASMNRPTMSSKNPSCLPSSNTKICTKNRLKTPSHSGQN